MLLCDKFGLTWPSGSEEDLIVVKVFLMFRYYLHLEKGVVLHFYKLNLYTRGCFVSSLVEFGSGEEDENVKTLQTDGQTDR